MWVKICANTNVEDAVAAAELGADALGFVFAPSRRQVTAEQVRSIAAELPDGVERVGVFGDAAAEEIARATETARLTAVQLHGGFDQVLTERLSKLLPQVALIQTVPWEVSGDPPYSEMASRFDRLVHTTANGTAANGRVLVDAKVKGASGGTGISFSWTSAEALLARSRDAGLRIIVAGGLRPENVAEAIRTLKPWGVDVASGVESQPGKKDLRKLRDFMENARGA